MVRSHAAMRTFTGKYSEGKMRMVKSLLLGSAAGLVTIAGAQAADLPVKAKPVQYVKICSLYGVGFYYIPGTDMCLKIGGWVRAEYAYGDYGNLAWGWANGNVNNRTTNNSTWRARGYITADARNQTEYGTVRGYIAVGVSGSDVNGAGNTFDANRAFIQLAGFTFGQAQSFFDFYSVPATSYWGTFPASDTGDPGWKVLGYTAQFGNGFSGTIAAEMRRTTQIVNTGQPSGVPVASRSVPRASGHMAASRHPDIVANLRVDQAWGSAQIMGALHQVNSSYYGGSRSQPSQWSSRRQVGLCHWRRHQAERSNDQPGRLLSGPDQLHPGCPALCIPDAQLELGQGRGGG